MARRTAPPLPDDITLVEALARAAEDDAPLATFHGSGAPRRVGARAALASALRWGSALQRLGARRGEPIAIMLPTSEDFIGAFFGALWIGAIPMPLATPMTFGGMERYLAGLDRVVAHSGATILVGTRRVIDAAASTSLARRLGAGLTPDELPALAVAVREAALDPDQPAILQYTSGTTRDPKGVLVSHRAAVSNARAIAHGLRLTDRDVGVSWLPLYHDMGLVGGLLTNVVRPYALHLLPTEAFVMRPRRWLELIDETRATISVAPNFAYELVAKRAAPEGLDLSCWRAALNGAEPVHATTLRRFAERFAVAGLAAPAITPVYGLAEATLAVTMGASTEGAQTLAVDRAALSEGRVVPSSQPHARELVGLGAPVRGTSIAIVDPDGREVAAGRVGEVSVRSPSLMSGYHRDDAASARALVGGALRTGDLGFVRDGQLYLTGRLRALIIQGGRNVHPEDVERVALDAAEEIHAAAAFAMPDAQRGTEELVVMIEARGLDVATKSLLATRVRGELLAQTGVRADRVVFRPIGAIPRTSSGKLRRGACAELLAADEIMERESACAPS